jgi:hypothetical protein
VSHGSKLTNDEVKFVAPQWYLDLLAKQQTSKVGDALCGLLMWMMRARRDEAAKASRKPKLRGRHWMSMSRVRSSHSHLMTVATDTAESTWRLTTRSLPSKANGAHDVCRCDLISHSDSYGRVDMSQQPVVVPVNDAQASYGVGNSARVSACVWPCVIVGVFVSFVSIV